MARSVTRRGAALLMSVLFVGLGVVVSSPAGAAPPGGKEGGGSTSPCQGPVSLDALQEVSLGPAVRGLPLNAAEITGGQVHVVTLDLSPAQIVTFDLATGAVVAQRDFTAAQRVWAMTSYQGTVYLGVWNASGPDLWTFTPASGELAPVADLPNNTELWDLDAAEDGLVYGGSDATGTVHVYDPKSKAQSALSFPDEAGSHVGAVEAATAEVYAGSRRNGAKVVAIDRASGLPRVLVDDDTYGTGVTALEAAGDLLVAGTEGSPHLLVVDLAAGALRHAVQLPGSESTAESVEVVDGAAYVSVKPSGTVHRVDLATGELTDIGRPVPGAPNRALMSHQGELLGANALDTLWSRQAGDTVRTNLVAAGARGAAMAQASAAAGAGYVHVAANNRLHSRVAGETAPVRNILSGEAKDLAVLDGQVYAAVYPYGRLVKVDPTTWATTVVSDWTEAYERPHDMTLTATHAVIGASSATYGHGGLIRVSLADGAVTVDHDPLRGQSVHSVAVDGATAYLGGDGSDAKLSAWDTTSRAAKWTVTPAPRSGPITGMHVSGRDLYVVTEAGTYLRIDAGSGRVKERRTVAAGGVGEVLAAHGQLYIVSTDALVRLNLTDGTLTTVVTGLAANPVGRPRIRMGDSCELYLFRSTNLIRLG